MTLAWAVTDVCYLLTGSRILFAASFDRLIPSAFANVSDRFHTPYLAVIILSICGAIYATIFWHFGTIAAVLNFSITAPVCFSLPIVAVLLFPIVKRDMYTRIYGSLQGAWKLILTSTVVLCAFGFYIFAETSPLVSGTYLGASLSLAYEAVLALVLAGGVVYLWGRHNAHRAGFDIRNIFAEIPPE